MIEAMWNLQRQTLCILDMLTVPRPMLTDVDRSAAWIYMLAIAFIATAHPPYPPPDSLLFCMLGALHNLVHCSKFQL